MRRASGDIDRLIADLQSSDSIRRDAAVARLRILGSRALPRLIDLVAAHESAARCAPWRSTRSKDSTMSVRSTSPFDALRDGDIEVVIAALGVLRRWVAEETGTRLLDAITAIAVDRSRDARVRVAALAALSELPEHLVRPIRDQAPPPESAGPSLDDPVQVREWIQAYGAARRSPRCTSSSHARESASMPSRPHGCARNGCTRAAARIRRWPSATASSRSTTCARRSKRRRRPAAVVPVNGGGDRRCELPRAARSRVGGRAGKDLDWNHQLSTTAATIMRREKLTGRSAVVKKLRANFPGFI